MGVRLKEIRSEIVTAMVRVTANSRKSRPTMPPMNRMGMKSAVSEMVIESTVKPISRAPRKAAAMRERPASR